MEENEVVLEENILSVIENDNEITEETLEELSNNKGVGEKENEQ